MDDLMTNIKFILDFLINYLVKFVWLHAGLGRKMLVLFYVQITVLRKLWYIVSLMIPLNTKPTIQNLVWKIAYFYLKINVYFIFVTNIYEHYILKRMLALYKQKIGAISNS